MSRYRNISLFLAMPLLPMFVIAKAELPDPTRPANFVVDDDIEPVFFEDIDINEQINWRLSAVRISTKDRSAIINGQLVRIGDDVGPATVLEINPLSVVISHDDRKLIIRLFNNIVNKDYKSRR